MSGSGSVRSGEELRNPAFPDANWWAQPLIYCRQSRRWVA
jgi:hypothetical protein